MNTGLGEINDCEVLAGIMNDPSCVTICACEVGFTCK